MVTEKHMMFNVIPQYVVVSWCAAHSQLEKKMIELLLHEIIQFNLDQKSLTACNYVIVVPVDWYLQENGITLRTREKEKLTTDAIV